jgi:hypothetical protein
MSGVPITLRIASEALLSRIAKAAAVSATSLVPGSLVVSKKRSRLNDPTVNSSAAGAGAGIAESTPVTTGTDVGSTRIVYVRNA